LHIQILVFHAFASVLLVWW